MNSIKEFKKQLTASGAFEFFGLKMTQIPEALTTLSTLLQISKPTKIIEFGTGYAGLSVLFNLYAKINNIEFITYDVTAHRQDILELTKIDFRLKDLQDEKVIEEIKLEIRSNTKGRTMLLCDALKSEEAKRYCPILKNQDLILIHDYSYLYNGENFKNSCVKYGWTAPQEQWFERFGEEFIKNKIHAVCHEEFEDVLWFCGIKIDE